MSKNAPIPDRGKIIDHRSVFPLQPNNISTKTLRRSLTKAFDGETDTADAAQTIIKIFQAKGRGWYPFSHRELEDWRNEDLKSNPCRTGHGIFFFSRLIEPGRKIENDKIVPWGGGWIQENGSYYWATEEFIWRCYFGQPINIHSKEDQALIQEVVDRLRSDATSTP